MTPRAAGFVALALCIACASGASMRADDALRPATDAPARFEPDDPALRLADGDTIAGDGCRSPMVDPRDGTRFRFVRASVPVADYEIPEGRYGARAGELLRLECNTGRPLGLVRR